MAPEPGPAFGDVDAESESRRSPSQFASGYFAETPFAQAALRPETYLIVGRRGSGKTALAQFLMRQAAARDAISLNVDEPELYAAVMAELAAFPRQDPMFTLARLRNVWDLVLWRMIFARTRGEAPEIAAAYELLRDKRQLPRLRGPRFGGVPRPVAILLPDERFARAREAVLALARHRPVMLVIDAREAYDVHDDALLHSMAALVMYGSEFQALYGAHGIHFKLFLSGELFPHLMDSVLLNPAKSVRQPLHLLWQPHDLLRLVCWRLYQQRGLSVRVDWSDPQDVLEKVWRSYFGHELTNAQGLQERTFTYVLRHTQLRPRQLIYLCNEIASHALHRGEEAAVTAEDIRSGVAEGQTTLAAEVLNWYSGQFRQISDVLDALVGAPIMLSGAQLDRCLRTTAAEWPRDTYSPASARALAAEVGIVGRVRERNDVTYTIDAEFEFASERRLVLTPHDDCAIHPMFYRRLNVTLDAMHRVLPFALDLERGGDDARVYYRQVRSFLGLPRRAESGEPETLVQTFVDLGPLMTLLGTRDHQIVYGRRGTGKTHALRYLEETTLRNDGIAVYIDLRSIGSTGGLYADSEVPLTERATRLLKDVLIALHDALLERSVALQDVELQRLVPALDELSQAITEVVVTGTVQTDSSTTTSQSGTMKQSAGVTLSATPAAALGHERTQAHEAEASERVIRSGIARNRVHFGRVGNALRDVVKALAPRRVWILLDEWSVIPADLQPLLADLIRRSLFPIAGVTVKIGAIEQRTHLQQKSAGGDYVGIEIGADASADVHLDDFLVYENNPERATEFFLELIFRHVCAVEAELGQARSFGSAQELLRAFTRRSTFEELVRAAEGVPRDAINILSLSAQRAGDSPIAMDDVRAAAKTWYQRDKEAAASADAKAHRLLMWIVDEVIGQRRTRGFLLRSNERHTLIDALFDSRVLHIVRRDIRAADQPGVRYDAYKIDYGCYVDLLTTPRGPGGLFAADADGNASRYFDVPPDDDRTIRRAILDLRAFETSVER